VLRRAGVAPCVAAAQEAPGQPAQPDPEWAGDHSCLRACKWCHLGVRSAVAVSDTAVGARRKMRAPAPLPTPQHNARRGSGTAPAARPLLAPARTPQTRRGHPKSGPPGVPRRSGKGLHRGEHPAPALWGLGRAGDRRRRITRSHAAPATWLAGGRGCINSLLTARLPVPATWVRLSLWCLLFPPGQRGQRCNPRRARSTAGLARPPAAPPAGPPRPQYSSTTGPSRHV
jgi:hypothetical protein